MIELYLSDSKNGIEYGLKKKDFKFFKQVL